MKIVMIKKSLIIERFFENFPIFINNKEFSKEIIRCNSSVLAY